MTAGRSQGGLREDVCGTEAAAFDEERVFQRETKTYPFENESRNGAAQFVAAVDNAEPMCASPRVVAACIHRFLTMGASHVDMVVVQWEVQMPLQHDRPGAIRHLVGGERLGTEERSGGGLD